MIRGKSPTDVAMTGTAQAIASNKVNPNGSSKKDGTQAFTVLNEYVDKLIEHGFLTVVPDAPPPPPGFPHEYRIVKITDLGRMVTEQKGPSAGAI